MVQKFCIKPNGLSDALTEALHQQDISAGNLDPAVLSAMEKALYACPTKKDHER